MDPMGRSTEEKAALCIVLDVQEGILAIRVLDDVDGRRKFFNDTDQYKGRKDIRTPRIPENYKIEQKIYNYRRYRKLQL